MINRVTTTRTVLTRVLRRAPAPSTECLGSLASSQTRKKSSALSVPIPLASLRDSVKTSFLDNAAKSNSRLWLADTQDKKTTHHYQNGTPANSINGSGVNDAITTLHDPLNDWNLGQASKFWPGVPPNLLDKSCADPIRLTKNELEDLSRSIREDLLGTDHPVLNQAASYFFEESGGGKKLRPMMVLLLSRALSESFGSKSGGSDSTGLFTNPWSWQRPDLPQAQRRLAEIAEIIHTASLFHDDVIDGADTRRSRPAVHTVFGNKVAILAGDYLLARASICLARLRHSEVIETMSTIIEHLVRGEIMQLRGTTPAERSKERLEYYLRKNFYKTGSLMANSCKSAALLGAYRPELVLASYKYGKHVGMAFQLVDDVLDFEGSVSSLGKPALSDLNSGIATAPVLFAAEEFPELEPMIDRKFRGTGDVDHAVDLVFRSNGIERTKELARVHAETAMEAMLELDSGIYRDALIHLAYKVVARTK